MTALSPATQAVLDAFYEGVAYADEIGPCNLAAALTALAVRIKGADGIRQDVFDIVNELQAHGQA